MALRIGAFLLASYNFVSATLIDYGVVKGTKYGIIRGGDRPEPTPAPGVLVKDYVVGAKNCLGDRCKGRRYSRSRSHSNKKIIVAAPGKVVVARCKGRRSNSCRRRSHSRSLSADRYININRKFADFKQIPHVDHDDENFAKAHNTIVSSNLVSSVGDTRHKVAKNFNQDRSNLPEHRECRNCRAKKDLLEYDNLLKTAVRPVKKVSVSLKSYSRRSISRSSSPLKYKIVVPGRLEKKTFRQVAIGERRENANPVITDFGVAKERSRSRSRSDRKFYRMNKFIRNITVSKEKPKTIKIRSYSRSISSSINEKKLRTKRLSRSRSKIVKIKGGYLKKKIDNESSSDFKYWLGLRPGRWYDAKRKDYGYYYGKRYVSADHYKRIKVIKKEPEFVEAVVKDYGLKH